MIFLICGQLRRHLLIEFFHLSDLLQMPTDRRKVNAEIFDNFWCSCKRISLDDPLNWLPLTSASRPLCSSFSSVSPPLQNFLATHAVHSLAVPGPNALLMLQIVSAALRPILNWYKKIARICLLSNIISTNLKVSVAQ